LEALGINLGYLIVQILNFIVIFVVLRAWVYKPLVKMLKNRRTTIAQGLEDANEAQKARANAEEDAQKIISEAQAKAADLTRESTSRAEEAAKRIRNEAQGELDGLREALKADMEEERQRLLRDVRTQVATLSIAAAQKLIGESLLKDEKQQHALVQAFFSRVQGSEVVVLEAAEGASAEVTSALPLTDAEKKAVHKDYIKGDVSDVAYKVDPGILGGLVIRVGDQVVDGSIAGQLQDLRQKL
jgi:F-type H+-transporting ATPase subunit b